MSTKVVIIDDDKIQMKHYQQALEAAGYDVVFISKTDDLTPVFEGTMHQDASFFIVDTMMPPGKRYGKEQTSYGEYTGLFVTRDLRTRFPVIPIILWTSAHIEKILEEAKKQADKTSICHWARKIEVSPSLLVEEINCYQKKGHFQRHIGRFLWKVVKIGGHILGVSADIKDISS
jgi:CheY-like chemotaxis protein